MTSQVPSVLKPGSRCAEMLNEAAECLFRRDFKNSMTAFQEGISLLLAAVKDEPNPEFKVILRDKVKYYLEHAEKLKQIMREEDSMTNNQHKTVNIKDNDTGYSYRTIIGPYCNEKVTEVRIEDPYIRSHHQIINFIHLNELFLKLCQNLHTINLITTSSPESAQLQEKAFLDISNSLAEKKVSLNVEYSTVLHDRQIRLNNGWIIKIGRGLDYFKKPKYKYGIGLFDQDFRECQETNVDIFYVGRSSQTATLDPLIAIADIGDPPNIHDSCNIKS